MEMINEEWIGVEREKNLDKMDSAKKSKGLYLGLCIAAVFATLALAYVSVASIMNGVIALVAPLIPASVAVATAKSFTKHSGIYKNAVAQERYFEEVLHKKDSKNLREELTTQRQKESEQTSSEFIIEQSNNQAVKSESTEERDKREIKEINDFLSK